MRNVAAGGVPNLLVNQPTRARRASWLCSVVLSLGLLASACGSTGTGHAAGAAGGSGKSVVIATVGSISNLDPLLGNDRALDTAEQMVSFNVYEPLLRRNAQGVLQPDLATSLPTQMGGNTWQFKLRKGVEFSNGVPFSAAAVVDTIKTVLNKTFSSSWYDRVSSITAVTAVDNYTVDVQTKGFDPNVPSELSLIDIVPPGYVQHLSTLQRAPIGTGPYILKSISSAGDMAVLERNPHYWGTTPAVSQVTVKQIDDDQTRLAALQSGGADIITDVPPDLASSLPAVAVNQSIENSGILFNALAGVTANQNVRIALNLALDKNTMVAKLYNKYAQVSNCQYTSAGSTGYDPHLKPYPYDPAKARALLQSAGAIGKTIDLETASDYAHGRQVVESVASYWEAVGLKVNIVISPHASFIGDIFKGRQRPAAMFVLAGDDLRDASQTNRFFATGLSLSAYSNPQLDSLYKQASNAQSPSNRTALLEQVEKFACDQALIGFLWNSLYIDGHRSGLNMIPRQEGWIYFPEISFK